MRKIEPAPTKLLTSGVLWLPDEEYDADAAKDYIEKVELVIKVTDEFIEWWFMSE